ncbi:MAG: DNA primase catalytic subunit PriS [Candidatus Methanogaster sp.]|uniref:DNA primase catalytic subunit PriS n=1 Tax=Candidatus Methanogaster sp. TaxID=3386292 RepID=A0AC61L174_9EURY|nr:MAG: DNA primase catalytic subunit PriS [ANME-2 cluster archaeon]
MNERTKNFLREKFKEYYLEYPIQLPPGFESREWGFVMFDALPKIVMYRHKSFHSRPEALEYLRSMAPAHAFFSVAYYERPEAGTMADKKWLGADLIFDLDADHLPDAPKSYSAMLANVKDETLKLLNFLTDDFGFSEDLIDVVFSGGRGYHIHVRDQRVRTLGSAQRREIVDYVSGAGLSLKQILSEESGGWGAKTNRWIVKYLQGLRDRDDALKILQKFDGIGKARAKALINAGNDANIKLIRNGDTGFLKDIPESFWNELRLQAVQEIGASVDEPVTGDIKRLIRLPTSLHGGSSMRVVPLTLQTIEMFDPLNDAVVFSDAEISVAAESPASCDLRGNHFEIEEGVNTVPGYAGIYLMCRGAVEYTGRV